jgi:hypothetical protein
MKKLIITNIFQCNYNHKTESQFNFGGQILLKRKEIIKFILIIRYNL